LITLTLWASGVGLLLIPVFKKRLRHGRQL
jgi:hypothetical protein